MLAVSHFCTTVPSCHSDLLVAGTKNLLASNPSAATGRHTGVALQVYERKAFKYQVLLLISASSSEKSGPVF